MISNTFDKEKLYPVFITADESKIIIMKNKTKEI